MFHYIFIGNVSLHFLTIFATTLALSGGIKAAQFFSHVWLPDAMEAPTPASALIHSSTLVVAGVFLIIRFSIVFEFTLWTNYMLILLGGATLAFGSITATFQQDIKKLVAYSTISQIGYLVCGCGFCCYEEVLLYLIIHALNKAFLFVLVGYTVHFFAGNTDMRQMGGFYIYSFDLTVLFLGVCVNLAGIPYSAGFIGKELLLFQVLRDDFLSLFVRGCWMVSFFFTPIYMLMLLFLVLFGPKKSSITTYITYWNLKFKDYLSLNYNSFDTIHLSSTQKLTNMIKLNMNIVRYQVTAVTSRLTTYVLILFWTFFFFFGNFLLLILLNYNTLTETIFSSTFTTIKQHAIFSLNTSSAWLSQTIFFYILVLTTFSLIFLLNLRYTFTYNYFYLTYLFDLIIFILITIIWLV
jgi:NADH:ubiquinone oxidoreductase subunit 5 (subunit L)/multisubunit Na+/H+ antiporter MnhA subunit